MSNNREESRRNIIPKPRRPIHSDITMVRYGITEPNTGNTHDNYTREQGNQGSDQVDNIMSKMARQPSPLPMRIKIKQISNSCLDSGEYNVNDTDDSELENEEPSLTKSIAEDSHNYSGGSHNYSDLKIKSSHIKATAEGPQNISKLKYIFLPLVTVLVIVIAVWWKVNDLPIKTQNKSTYTVNSHEVAFENNMDHLKEKYNIDDTSILKIKTGISTIFSRMDAGSFMFVYNSSTNNFDSVRFDRFINAVARTASRYLRNNITPVHHTVIVSSNLDMQEHGELIRMYRDDVERTGVMLVKEVDAVPADLAMAFHYYCDEYDPVVKRSAIFFTLNLANCSNKSDKQPTHDFVEECLARKWQSVPSENMRPLLTRIVDIIIDVTRIF